MDTPLIPLKTKNIPTVFIIFGATGDLMGKKIVPALFHLYKKNKFPKLFKIIGFSRRKLTEEKFIQFVREILVTHSKGSIQKEELEEFLKYFLYQQGNFDQMESYKTLAERMGIIDGGWNVCSNKLFYLAVPPQYYKNICEHLAHSGLTIPCGADEGWTRVIVEKPFGQDLKSAEELDILLSKLFKEEQIYRIDHYLAKEMLQNILTFRFANSLFEDVWNNKHIESIEIRIRESIGAEGRGQFYDGIGALKDVGQNHLLQMLALITMDDPKVLDSDHVRLKRSEVIKTLEPLSFEEIKNYTFRAQYKGYRDIEGVSPTSTTDTYFKVIAKLKSERWRGVKITLEAGKSLPLKKDILVTFKKGNRVTFHMEPKEGITIEFWSKKPGLEYKFTKRKFNFTNRRVNERVQYVEEYEKLLLDCITGNQILFLSTPEIAACWSYIDPIVNAWKDNLVPLEYYSPGSRQAISMAGKKLAKTTESRAKEIGIIGLGKMGGNVARRLVSQGWQVVGYNRTSDVTRQLENEGVTGAYSLSELKTKLSKPRVVLTVLTAGKATDEILEKLSNELDRGDIIADLSNSLYTDTQKRAKMLDKKGIKFIDVGISGGPAGALNGACLMIGGDKKTFAELEPLFKDMAAPNAVAHFEGVGAGHFVKMVHNGIEYGMMQSIAEGMNILKNGPYKLNLTDVTNIYMNGSVVESRLVGWLRDAFIKFGNNLDSLSGSVGYTGEGAWTAETAKKLKLPSKIIEESVKFRVESQKKPSFAGKILTGMRNQFGGHSIQKGKMT